MSPGTLVAMMSLAKDNIADLRLLIARDIIQHPPRAPFKSDRLLEGRKFLVPSILSPSILAVSSVRDKGFARIHGLIRILTRIRSNSKCERRTLLPKDTTSNLYKLKGGICNCSKVVPTSYWAAKPKVHHSARWECPWLFRVSDRMILDGVKNLGGFHRLPRPLTTSSTGDGVSECAERAEPDLRGPLRRDRKPAPRKPRDFELRCLLRSDNMSGLCKHVKERVLILITAQQGCSETTNGFQDESQIPRIEAELVDFRNFRDTARSEMPAHVNNNAAIRAAKSKRCYEQGGIFHF
ncbi:hypothetical protein RJ035_006902 [Blastomyces gilchristii]